MYCILEHYHQCYLPRKNYFPTLKKYLRKLKSYGKKIKSKETFSLYITNFIIYLGMERFVVQMEMEAKYYSANKMQHKEVQ